VGALLDRGVFSFLRTSRCSSLYFALLVSEFFGVEHICLFREKLHSFHMSRPNPNIIVTGTPGVGKTTHAEELARSTGLKHISVNQIVKDEGFHEGKDEETGSWIVDEDKVRRNITIELGGGLICS
jgi:hypothetical protein